VSELPDVIVTDPPALTCWSWAWVMANVWVWPLEEEVEPETPAEGGDWTSFWLRVKV